VHKLAWCCVPCNMAEGPTTRLVASTGGFQELRSPTRWHCAHPWVMTYYVMGVHTTFLWNLGMFGPSRAAIVKAEVLILIWHALCGEGSAVAAPSVWVSLARCHSVGLSDRHARSHMLRRTGCHTIKSINQISMLLIPCAIF